MRKSEIPLQKHTLSLFEGDFARLIELHPEASAANVIRLLVRAHINRTEEQAAKQEEQS